MKNSVFKFKQFAVCHGKSKMKVGTDGVLLGAWAKSRGASSILDIGAGCGLITLMLAQKNQVAKIDAVEPDEGSFEDLNHNFSHSPWSTRLEGYKSSIQDFESTTQYDLIVSNPPYFNQGTKSPDIKRHHTRHTNTLSHNELIDNLTRLLAPKGIASFILPYPEYLNSIDYAGSRGFFEIRKTNFKSKKGNEVERVLFSISLDKNPALKTDEIVQYTDDGAWSLEYKNLTKDFYLKL